MANIIVTILKKTKNPVFLLKIYTFKIYNHEGCVNLVFFIFAKCKGHLQITYDNFKIFVGPVVREIQIFQLYIINSFFLLEGLTYSPTLFYNKKFGFLRAFHRCNQILRMPKKYRKYDRKSKKHMHSLRQHSPGSSARPRGHMLTNLRN